jgi:hypothetical protein
VEDIAGYLAVSQLGVLAAVTYYKQQNPGGTLYGSAASSNYTIVGGTPSTYFTSAGNAVQVAGSVAQA